MSISPKNGARGSKDMLCFKYDNTLEWESRFTLGLIAAKNIEYIKKWF